MFISTVVVPHRRYVTTPGIFFQAQLTRQDPALPKQHVYRNLSTGSFQWYRHQCHEHRCCPENWVWEIINGGVISKGATYDGAMRVAARRQNRECCMQYRWSTTECSIIFVGIEWKHRESLLVVTSAYSEDHVASDSLLLRVWCPVVSDSTHRHSNRRPTYPRHGS